MNTFMIGYVIVWVTVVVYLGFISQRQRQLRQQYEELRRRVEQSDASDTSRHRAA